MDSAGWFVKNCQFFRKNCLLNPVAILLLMVHGSCLRYCILWLFFPSLTTQPFGSQYPVAIHSHQYFDAYLFLHRDQLTVIGWNLIPINCTLLSNNVRFMSKCAAMCHCSILWVFMVVGCILIFLVPKHLKLSFVVWIVNWSAASATQCFKCADLSHLIHIEFAIVCM
jgi:hypothetical protein